MGGFDCTSCVFRIASIVLIILIILLVLLCVCGARPGAAAFQGGAGCEGSGAAEDYDDQFEGGDDDYPEGDYDGGRPGKDLAVREPLFQSIVDGKVHALGRINRGPFKLIKEGDEVTIRRSRAPDDKTEYPGLRRHQAKITKRADYASAEDMIKAEGAAKLFPGAKTAEKAVEEFRGSFHTPADEQEHGVVAFHFKLLKKE